MPKSLTDEELMCLRRLNSEPDTQSACSQDTLDRLKSKGLIEQRPLLSLPVQPQRSGYHLTPAGQRALAAAGRS